MRYEVDIEGIGEMMQNRCSKDLIDEQNKIPRGKGFSEAKEKWEEENWNKKLNTEMIDGKQEVVWTMFTVRAFLIQCSKKSRIACPKSVGKTWTSYIESCVLPESSIIKYKKLYPKGMMVNGNPSAKGGSSKVYKIRPCMSGWTCKLVFVDTQDLLDKEIVEEMIRTGGLFIGLSDYRPLFGRFAVKKVTAIKGM